MGWNPLRRSTPEPTTARTESDPAAQDATVEHRFANRKDHPIYISVEPWPECFELEPGETLTLVFRSPDAAINVQFITDRDLVVDPTCLEIDYLIDGQPASDRSWDFKHDRPE